MSTISVIVPIYNVERYLACCIESILNQTYTDFELILVDDGSPDHCGLICNQYAQKDNRVRVIHKDNGGVSLARNVALDIASGRYVTFCDSDDYYKPDWLESLITVAKNNHADMVVGNYLHVSEDKEIFNQSHHESGTYVISTPEEKISYTISHILGNKHGWEIWSRLFRLDIIQSNNIRFCETCENFAEDLGFVLEYLLYTEKLLSIEASGYCYRNRSGSMMRSSQNIARLDSVNEIGLRFLEVAKIKLPQNVHNVFPIIFYLIMQNQYSMIIGTNRYPYIKEEQKKIRRYAQWKANTKAIFRCKKLLKYYFGNIRTTRILLFCRYCIHGNWKLFSLQMELFRRIHHVL